MRDWLPEDCVAIDRRDGSILARSAGGLTGDFTHRTFRDTGVAKAEGDGLEAHPTGKYGSVECLQSRRHTPCAVAFM
jgi:hypothetical protein